jgi:Phage integrase, N-terminal SAM-like domain
MAHIEKRTRKGRVTYRARYRDPAGREKARVFNRRIDAQRFLTEVENSKLRGTWTDPALGRVLFQEWLAEWWSTTTNLRPSTRARDEMLLRRYALPRFGNQPLAAIRQREVRAWVADLAATDLAPSTVRKTYHLLGKVLAAAVDAGMIAQSPCQRVPLPKIEREEMRFLTPPEIARLADAIRPSYRALVLVGAYGGLRIRGVGRPASQPGRPAARHGRGRRDHHRSRRPAARGTTQDPGQPPHRRAPPRRGQGADRPPGNAGSTGRLRVHRPKRADRCGSSPSGLASGGQRPATPGWMPCAFMTFATRPSPCGSPPAPTPKRWPPEPGIPR